MYIMVCIINVHMYKMSLFYFKAAAILIQIWLLGGQKDFGLAVSSSNMQTVFTAWLNYCLSMDFWGSFFSLGLSVGLDIFNCL